MNNMKTIQIFLASSIKEFEREREQLELFIRNVSDHFEAKYKIKIRIVLCENIDPSYTAERKQEEYNNIIRECEMVFFIFFTKLGEFTYEEFLVAKKQFEEFGKPKIYTYFKNLSSSETMEQSLVNFMSWLDNSLGHYHTNFDHFSPNYRHTVTVGLPGLIAEADASLEAHREDPEKTEMLQAMRHVLCGFRQMILNYIAAAETCKQDPEYDVDRLNFIIENCTAIANGKPQTFAQALQLIWFCHNAFLLEDRYAMALGRLDQYLYPFYKADIEAGRITDEQVIEYLENVFIRLQNDVVNICIGGQNVHGECEANELSHCILWAVHNCHVPGPNLSFRVTENTPDQLLDEALQVLGTGLGYPALMNDDINIAALRRFGYKDEDIYDYSMVGCIENFITGKQPAWSDTGMLIPPFIDYVFNRGISVTNKSFGIDTGDVADIHSMEAFMAAFEKQLEDP